MFTGLCNGFYCVLQYLQNFTAHFRALYRPFYSTVNDDRVFSYTDFTDFVSRVDLRSANKRTLESLAYSGGFDSFGINRSQYFEKDREQSFVEKMIKFGNKVQDSKNSNQVDMFGESSDSTLKPPEIIDCPEWPTMDLLSKEKEFTLARQKIEFALESFYRSASSLVFQLNKRYVSPFTR